MPLPFQIFLIFFFFYLNEGLESKSQVLIDKGGEEHNIDTFFPLTLTIVWRLRRVRGQEIARIARLGY